MNEVSGFNGRYSPDRFNVIGEGSKGLNIMPTDAQTVVVAVDPAGNYDSAAAIPAGVDNFEVIIDVTEIFNGVPTLTVGSVGTPNLLVTIGNAVDLTTLGVKRVVAPILWPVASVLRAVIGGAPNQGSATITANYII